MKKNFFLDHPVFSIVVSIVIVLLGCIGLVMLPVDQYPSIVPPVVRVSASYPGADALTVTQAVATPIEQELNGTPGMLYMDSKSTNSGGFSALVTFDIDVDPELAAVDVQNRIKKAEARLPAEVVQNGISVEKETANKLMTITVLSLDPKFDEAYLSNYVTLNVVDLLRRVPGVGSVSNVGSRYYSMQIHVMPDKLADLGLTVSDIRRALLDQNRESAAGVLGQAPLTDVDLTMPIIARGRLSSPEEFGQIVLRADDEGSVIRLRDVADIRLDAQSYATESGINRGNAAVLNINMLPGANALDVAANVKKELREISRNFPDGMSYVIPFDMTEYISDSIHHVYRTFFEALVIVILVVFLSLQNWRATVIPIIAVPISLIGTFGVMLVFGFSLNMLTLLGLILAIGIVVDDAIVVVENVDRIMESDHVDAPEATRRAMNGLGSALVAMSLVLCAVFVPVSFLPGITGSLYRQFTITIAVSVIISTIVALTLSPVMCAALLRPAGRHRKARIFRLINYWLARGNNFYCRMILRAVNAPRRMIAAFGIVLAMIWMLNRFVPTSFMSPEDQGYFTVELELPEGATIERTRRVTDRAMEFLMADRDVEYVLNVTGSSARTGTNQAHATLTVILKPAGERGSNSLAELRSRVLKEFAGYPECKAYISTPPIIPGMGQSGGFEMVLEARGDASYDDLSKAVDTLRAYAANYPALAEISSSLQEDIPQVFFDVDRDRAQQLGIPVSDIFSTMKAFTGSVYINDFNMFNRIYRVYVQADAPYRAHRDNLNLFFLRSAGGVMVPVTSVGTTHYVTGSGTISRFNMFNAATISGEAAQGHSTGEAMKALQEIVDKHLPDNIGVEWSGLSYQQKHETANTGMVLGLAFLFVFLVLAAQYESWSIPMAVLLSLPVAGMGAYAGIWMCGLENNVYFQIGLVMLVGLVAKNAILIVEFASEATARGADAVAAAVEAARLRFRPIVMTSLAFTLGLLPLVFASGPGSAARRDIGTGVFFGMLVAITVGIIFVPFFFVMITRIKQRIASRRISGAAILALPLAVAFMQSCSGVKNCAAPQLEPMPESVPGIEAAATAADSLTLADMEWWRVYTDPALSAMITEALAHNRDLNAAMARLEEARRLYGVAALNIAPQVTGIVGGTYETNDYYGEKAVRDPELSLKATVAWEIDLFGAGKWERAAAKASWLASEYDARAAQMSLVAEVARLYYTLVALDNELDIVNRTLETRQESLRMAKLRFEGGLTHETPYRQAQVELATTAALVPGLESRITAARNALSLLMGRYPAEYLERGTLQLAPVDFSHLPVTLPSTLLTRRPDVQAAEQRLKGALANAGVSYADRFPRLRLALTGGWENDELQGFFSSPFSYTLGNIAGSIFDFGRKKRKYQASIAAYDRARAQYEQAVLAAFRDVSDAATAFSKTAMTVTLRRDLRDAALKYMELAHTQYRAGTLNYIDVLDAQRRYFDAQIGLSNAVRDQYLALATLYKALGGGWE
ncbi:MAG: efflux RND transporter permease subunit [Muribaculaceae bacterium]|nr:efflux RND transporter permease subunit [Muribaculaceae bacterium]